MLVEVLVTDLSSLGQWYTVDCNMYLYYSPDFWSVPGIYIFWSQIGCIDIFWLVEYWISILEEKKNINCFWHIKKYWFFFNFHIDIFQYWFCGWLQDAFWGLSQLFCSKNHGMHGKIHGRLMHGKTGAYLILFLFSLLCIYQILFEMKCSHINTI